MQCNKLRCYLSVESWTRVGRAMEQHKRIRARLWGKIFACQSDGHWNENTTIKAAPTAERQTKRSRRGPKWRRHPHIHISTSIATHPFVGPAFCLFVCLSGKVSGECCLATKYEIT